MTTLFICIFYSLADTDIPESVTLKVYPTTNNFAKEKNKTVSCIKQGFPVQSQTRSAKYKPYK
ncbi:hypothetical protein TREVI0001_2571 [Treponema vincentii ATCC 35580]|uniref:Uncharacterized protein n=1 Tax=Treponema vincentii ATCC 35580 TaxID=596324 RepID=C8PNE1_9SPIR|nr:hypothetical protein TREVI0001_2571 [Treponema vincentii ATCC 35580]